MSGDTLNTLSDQRPFSLVTAKLAEARFFCENVETAGTNVFEARCYFSAFVSAGRSVTFVLQAVLKKAPGFDAWWKERQRALADDPLCRYFVDRRNEALKTGETRINSGSVQPDASGTPVVRHFFSSGLEAEPIDTDVAVACRRYLAGLEAIVADAQERFPRISDPDWYYRSENLAESGLTVEDLEELVGLPRGWTSGIPIEERLAALRDGTSPIAAEAIGRAILDLDTP